MEKIDEEKIRKILTDEKVREKFERVLGKEDTAELFALATLLETKQVQAETEKILLDAPAVAMRYLRIVRGKSQKEIERYIVEAFVWRLEADVEGQFEAETKEAEEKIELYGLPGLFKAFP